MVVIVGRDIAIFLLVMVALLVDMIISSFMLITLKAIYLILVEFKQVFIIQFFFAKLGHRWLCKCRYLVTYGYWFIRLWFYLVLFGRTSMSY